jgi:hypothetical protein
MFLKTGQIKEKAINLLRFQRKRIILIVERYTSVPSLIRSFLHWPPYAFARCHHYPIHLLAPEDVSLPVDVPSVIRSCGHLGGNGPHEGGRSRRLGLAGSWISGRLPRQSSSSR